MVSRILPALLLVALLAGCGGGAASASCGGGAMAKLTVWHETSQFGAAFSLAGAPPDARWQLVVVHEGRVEWRGTAQTDAHGAFKVVRRLEEYQGADDVTVRATGPGGRTCAASATLN